MRINAIVTAANLKAPLLIIKYTRRFDIVKAPKAVMRHSDTYFVVGERLKLNNSWLRMGAAIKINVDERMTANEYSVIVLPCCCRMVINRLNKIIEMGSSAK
jgi:hypothetical protein